MIDTHIICYIYDNRWVLNLKQMNSKLLVVNFYASESAKWAPEVKLDWLKCPPQGLKKWAIQAP